MAEQFEPARFFRFLGFDSGDQQYSCPDLKTLNVYCRGDEAQLERLISHTPLHLEGDIFVVTVADFENCTMTRGRYFDSGIIIPVSYGEEKGGTYFFEFEDEHWSTATGRELWGYPKRYAKISLEQDETGARGRTWHYETALLDGSVEFDDAVTNEAWSHLAFAPNIQVRAVPEFDGDSYSHFDVIKRNTVANFVTKERRYGHGSVSLGPVDIGSGVLDGRPLEVVEVLGAEYTVGDFASTAENGTPVTLGSLV
ncbi:acetoacetate decarboxylase family protein [Leucobacter sp. wl10]|uniref:acetoacetate decarboxylase family protein n=1 Tax=Leucobacter sp. wl10 TaxID=2304677 RepID=UPI0013C32E40|nr:acetoacetate decarboxylase family protein [Leucobacter sp. wl10]